MRIVGIRLNDGRTAWVAPGSWTVHPGDRVVLLLDGEECDGEVFVTPEQFLGGVEAPSGEILRAGRGRPLDAECGCPIGADMPTLGSRVGNSEVDGTVVSIDAVERTVTVRGGDGTDVTIPWPQSEGGEIAASNPSVPDERALVTESVGSAPAPRP